MSSNASISPLCHHQPFNPERWVGRDEPYESDRAVYWYQLAQPYQAKAPQEVCLVGFACDQGVRRNLGRVGAKDAPCHIRQAFAKLPVSQMIQNRYKGTMDSLLGDQGDVVCDDNNTLMTEALEQTQMRYANHITQAVVAHQSGLSIGLGGGHAIAFASFSGLWQALLAQSGSDHTQLPDIGIINFDAHLDLRQAPVGTSGTPFRQIAEHCTKHGQPFNYCAIGISALSNSAALFDRADRLNVSIISDNDCYRLAWPQIQARLDEFLRTVDVVYLTIDMDAFPASLVPGVSAPAAKGIPLDIAERCLSHIIASGKVKVADIAEINPTYDIDSRSAKVAARLLATLITEHLQLNQ